MSKLSLLFAFLFLVAAGAAIALPAARPSSITVALGGFIDPNGG
jgi:hypothetical protein